MTDPASSSGPSRLPLVVAIGVVLLLVIGGGVWFAFVRDTSPPPASIGTATKGITGGTGARSSTTRAGTGASTSGSGSTGAPVTPAGDVWNIDTSITSDAGGNFGRFRIKEVLGGGIGAVDAVGESKDVAGSITIDGTTLAGGDVTIDLTKLTTDRAQRQGPMARTLETTKFPDATFTIRGPVALGKAPEEGATLSIDVPGTFSIHGTTKDVTVKVDATITQGVLTVVGSAPFTLADYGLTKPSGQIVVSLEDSGTIEFQLYLTKAG